MRFLRSSLMLGGLGLAMAKTNGHPNSGLNTDGPLPDPTSASSASSVSPTSITGPAEVSTPFEGWFETTWNLPPMVLTIQLNLHYEVAGDSLSELPQNTNFSLALCQTNAVGTEDLVTNNTWLVVQFQTPFDLLTSPDLSFTTPALYNGTEFNPILLQNFFFCFGTAPQGDTDISVCHSYSPFFDLVDVGQAAPAELSAPISPTTAIQIQQITPAIALSQATVSATTAPASTSSASGLITITTDGSIITGMPSLSTVTTTTTPILSSSPVAVSSIGSTSQSSGGLSTGAKVGIALGALFFVAILLLVALFFLRRKHSRRSQPEQVMLTRDMHADSFSRNLIAEKEELNSSPLSGPSPVDHSLPIQRHSALSPYEPLPSAPYSGPAATAPLAISRRKPTTATMASTVSRGISNASTGSVLNPRSATTAGGAAGHEFEEYHDVPIYGDARHVPQLNTFSGASHSQAPFLGEEGMTAEEAARLEEEERRIDAAIEAAERERGNR